MDFQEGIDKIDLSLIDANTTTALDQPFIYGGQLSTTVAHSMTWSVVSGNTIIHADVNNNTHADIVIVLAGVHTLTQSDFIL
jgi:hypothetical protein